MAKNVTWNELNVGDFFYHLSTMHDGIKIGFNEFFDLEENRKYRMIVIKNEQKSFRILDYEVWPR